ncbi:MAG: tripartite tricarboxylate transporter substrate-binding protein [Proteobacteria bacterium]|nr:tripartite tricarboxylate transporter substrate-binding protein [Pseudomonadota bacterium]
MRSIFKQALPLAVIAAVGFATSPVIAADASYFAGKTLKIVIPYGPGGTYDKYGSSFAKHLRKHLPGQPNIILQHMPGAGGAKAMNFTYNIMVKDGRNMVVPLDNTVANQLMRPKKMNYKSENYNWLGSSNQTNVVLVVRSDSGVKTVEDMKNIPLIGATSGKSSSGYINPKLVWGLLGGNGRMVTGYKGSSGSVLAVEQGEAQMAAFNWLLWDSKVPHWFKGEKPFARAIVQVGIFKDPDLPDVPMLTELVKAEDRPVVDFIASAGPVGRGLAAPPGVRQDVVETLRRAVDGMNADPAFAAELKKKRLRLIPSTGETIQKVVEDAVKSATPDVVDRARKIIFGGSS